MNVEFTPKLLAAIAAVVVAIVALGGWFGLVSPQQSKAKTLDTKIAAEREQLTVAKLLAASQTGKGSASGLAQLATAMPAELQMSSVLRQVKRVAELSNVNLDSFAPAIAAQATGYQTVPISTVVSGRYQAIQRFLHRLRLQASSSRGRIHASGRLFDVQTIGMTPTVSVTGFSQLSATIQMSTFVYNGVVPAPIAPTTTESDSSDTSATSAEGTS